MAWKPKAPAAPKAIPKTMPSNLKGEAHSYDANRPARPVVSRYSK